MARWTDIAKWRGNGLNQGPGMVEHRGVVLHIADGYYEGTISWQRDPASRVSSHFVIGRTRGEVAQMVDTDTAAWTQSAGNGRWLSIEFAGFHKGHRLNPGGWERLTDWQVEAAAHILAKAHQVYGIPLQQTNSPNIGGLGYHSMGGAAWGNHPLCPGPDIIAARGRIIAQAKQIVAGGKSMNLSTRNKSFIIEADGSSPDTNSVGHQWARTHGYVHRLVASLLWGSGRYDELDTIAYPGTEDNPAPTSRGADGRRGASWRYAIQRIWRWSYWGFRRIVTVDDRTARMEATLAAQGELLAQIAAVVGVGDREQLVEQIAQRAAELVGQRSAADIAQYLDIVAVDDEDTISSKDAVE